MGAVCSGSSAQPPAQLPQQKADVIKETGSELDTKQPGSQGTGGASNGAPQAPKPQAQSVTPDASSGDGPLEAINHAPSRTSTQTSDPQVETGRNPKAANATSEIEEEVPKAGVKPYTKHQDGGHGLMSPEPEEIGLDVGPASASLNAAGGAEDFGDEEPVIPGNPQDSNEFLLALFGSTAGAKGFGFRTGRKRSKQSDPQDEFVSWGAFGKGMPTQGKGKKGKKGCSIDDLEPQLPEDDEFNEAGAAIAERPSGDGGAPNGEQAAIEPRVGLKGKVYSSDNEFRSKEIRVEAPDPGPQAAGTATSAQKQNSFKEITFETIASGPPAGGQGPGGLGNIPGLGGIRGLGPGKFGLDDEDEETEDAEPAAGVPGVPGVAAGSGIGGSGPGAQAEQAPDDALGAGEAGSLAPKPDIKLSNPVKQSKPKPESSFSEFSEIEEVVEEEPAGQSEAGAGGYDDEGMVEPISRLELEMSKQICTEIDSASDSFRKFLHGDAGSAPKMNSHLKNLVQSVDLDFAARETLMRIELMSRLIDMVRDDCLEYQQALRTMARMLRELVLTFFQTMRGTDTDFFVSVWELFSLFDAETQVLTTLDTDPDEVEKTKDLLHEKLPALVKEVKHWDGCRLKWPATGKWAYGLNLME